MSNLALTVSLQDVTAYGTKRRFTMWGTPGTAVAIEFGTAINSTTVARVQDPRATTLIQPPAPTFDLILSIPAGGNFASSPTFDETSSFIRYALIQGTVAQCHLDASSVDADDDNDDNTEM